MHGYRICDFRIKMTNVAFAINKIVVFRIWHRIGGDNSFIGSGIRPAIGQIEEHLPFFCGLGKFPFPSRSRGTIDNKYEIMRKFAQNRFSPFRSRCEFYNKPGIVIKVVTLFRLRITGIQQFHGIVHIRFPNVLATTTRIRRAMNKP